MPRAIAAALSVARASFNSSRVVKAFEFGPTMLTTMSVVALISFVAVATGLS